MPKALRKRSLKVERLSRLLPKTVSPDAPDDLEGLEEHLARLLLVDAERLECRWAQAAAQPHIEASAGQIVEHRRLLGDKQWVPERQDVDHAADADAYVVRAAAAISKLGEGTGAVGCR